MAGAFLTFVILEVARHLQYLWFRESGYVPSTQGWVMIAIAIAIAFLFEVAAVIFLVPGAIS